MALATNPPESLASQQRRLKHFGFNEGVDAAAAPFSFATDLEPSSGDDGPLWSLWLLDDNFNMREFVQRVLMMVTYVSEEEAEDIMMTASLRGGALVGTWEEALARHHYIGITGAGLRASLQLADAAAVEPPAAESHPPWVPPPAPMTVSGNLVSPATGGIVTPRGPARLSD